MLKFHNTMGNKLEVFEPVDKEKGVRIYSCGPTVYYYAHIGNFRAYMFADILRRYLKYKGYKVTHVINITDVDDKTIRDSKKEGLSLKEFTDKYTKAFFEDIEALNIEKVEYYPRATEHIEDMVKLIQKLQQRGHTYKAENSIYYKISTFPEYGKLSGIDLSKIKAGARVDVDEYSKENAYDFVLWKAPKEGEPYWHTPIGPGRPGWHIECSAMSMKYLGETFDIHTGAEDLIFPHHENEIAQSEGATGKPFVKYWLHCAFLQMEKEKMSKSKGNIVLLRDLLKAGKNPKAIRYFLFSAHYRKPLIYSEKNLRQAENSYRRMQDFIYRLLQSKLEEGLNEKIHEKLIQCKNKFESEMDNDLNTSGALGALFELIREVNISLSEKTLKAGNKKELIEHFKKFNQILGILEFELPEIPEDMFELIEIRQKARAKKDYETADKIREQLRQKGIILEDTPDGVRWRKI